MVLFQNNCRVEINEEKIVCDYLFLKKERNWTILLEDKLVYQSKSEEIILRPQTIIEFQFEIIDPTNRSPYTAVIYYIAKNEEEPIEFFRLSISQRIELTSKTKVYEFANEILKFISQKYNIPFSFKYYVETEKKRRGTSGLIIMMFVAFILAMLFGRR